MNNNKCSSVIGVLTSIPYKITTDFIESKTYDQLNFYLVDISSHVVARIQSYISFVGKKILRNNFYYINSECNISFLSTNEEFRNKGLATHLLQMMINFCKEHHINLITLDDDSDNFNTFNNVYVKAGFVYKINGYPEMYMVLR